MNENTKKVPLFGSGSFYMRALGLALPIMLQQLIQNLVSLIDNFMVAGLGDISMSGVNVAGQLLFVFLVYLNTICMAGGIFLTQFFGAKDEEGMKQAYRFKIIMGLAAFIPFTLVCLIFPREVLSLLLIGNTQADLILDEAVSYIRLVFFMGIPMTISMCMASSLRDIGEVKQPLVATIIATLTNTFFNWVLIYGNLGAPRMGVRGAAVATVIARCVELVLFIIIFLKRRPEFYVEIKEFLHVDWKLFGEILKKGSLILFCEMVWVFSETLTTAVYNGRGGADVVSGMSASFAIANLYFVAFGGIYSATAVIIGKSLGEGDLELAKKQKRWLLSGCGVFGCVMTVFGLCTTFLIPIVFGRLSREALMICREMVILMSFFMPIWVYMNAQQAIARAGGDTKMGAYTDAGLTILILIPAVLLLGIFTEVGPVFLYGVVKILDIIKVFIFHFWLKKELWLRNLTVEEDQKLDAKA